MTQEEQKLFEIDLSGRIPYGVKVWCKYTFWSGEKYCTNIVIPERKVWLSHRRDRLEHSEQYVEADQLIIKPYLRPMSSMTEEERNEYLDVKMQECERVALTEVYRPEAISIIMDWLNAHHFDYRGLIPMGLALEAPEGIYE